MNIKISKVLRIGGLVLIIFAFLLYIVMPIGLGYYATVRYGKSVGKPPKGFREIKLTTSDKVSLSAWYTPPQNGAVIILVHGATSSREKIRRYAKMLVENRFGVLAFDMRGHGESGGDGVNAYNWDGTRDVGAAVKYLSLDRRVKKIGGLGISLGGEILLGAASKYKKLSVIVSDGATYRSLGDYLALPSRRNLIRSFTTRLMYHSAGFFSGTNAPDRIVDSISKAEDTSFLFIAAGKVLKEIEYNRLFLKKAGDKGKLWVVRDVGHTKAFVKHPKDYKNKVIEFFNQKLLGEIQNINK